MLARFDGGLGLIHAVHGSPDTVRLAEGQLAVHAMPHHNDPEILAGWLREARPTGDAQFNVLIAHIGLDGLGRLVGSEAASFELPGEILSEAGELRLHRAWTSAQARPARDNAAYAGSLERLSWGDDAKEKGIVEVDLAAGRRHDDYLRLRAVPTRGHVELDPVDAASTSDLTAAIIARAENVDLAHAMVRLEVRNVTAPPGAPLIAMRSIKPSPAVCISSSSPARRRRVGVQRAARPTRVLVGLARLQDAPGVDPEAFLARAR